MSALPQAIPARRPVAPVVYPESDGKPMSDNTKQFRWIVVLYGNLAALFRQVANVFVSGNQFWFPVEGDEKEKQAPDVYVVFGVPKGDRPSYRQWEEGNVPMTVVFEIISPSNTIEEMVETFSFYEQHGVEEYYAYNPDKNTLQVFVRKGELLRRVRDVDGFTSPRLGIRFDLSGPEMVVYGPDGRRFLTFEEIEAARAREEEQRLAAEQRAEKAQQEAAQARQQVQQVQQEAVQARRQAAKIQADLTRLRELSRKSRRQEASADELRELDELEAENPSTP